MSTFEKHLDGYKAEEAVYNYAFNASNRELDEFVMQRVRATRTGGWWFMKEREKANPIPIDSNPVRLG